jgi:hypothetical protein
MWSRLLFAIYTQISMCFLVALTQVVPVIDGRKSENRYKQGCKILVQLLIIPGAVKFMHLNLIKIAFESSVPK